MAAILMTKEFWMESQFSIARHYGGIKINGDDYLIVNQKGMNVWQCTEAAAREGRAENIHSQESADLVMKDFVPYYRRLGRERFIDILERNEGRGKDELIGIMKDLLKPKERTDNMYKLEL